MKKNVGVVILTGLWMLAPLTGLSAESSGSEKTLSEARSSTLDSALKQTLTQVEVKSSKTQVANTEILRPPQVVSLSGPVVSGESGSAIGSSTSSVSGPAVAHQEPPFYVNPLSQTIRQIRDLVNGMNSPKQDKETPGSGQRNPQQSGNAPVAGSIAQ